MKCGFLSIDGLKCKEEATKYISSPKLFMVRVICESCLNKSKGNFETVFNEGHIREVTQNEYHILKVMYA